MVKFNFDGYKRRSVRISTCQKGKTPKDSNGAQRQKRYREKLKNSKTMK